MVSNMFYFHPYLGKIPILTNIFQMGWNHQPALDFVAQAGLPEDGSPQRTVREKLLDFGGGIALFFSGGLLEWQVPSLKLTYTLPGLPLEKKGRDPKVKLVHPRSLIVPPWKMMVGRPLSFWGWYIFRGYVKLPGGIPTIHVQVHLLLVSGRVLPKEFRES